jgi:hypothetical protein
VKISRINPARDAWHITTEGNGYQGYNQIVDSRSNTIAIVIGLGSFLCVCMLGLAVVAGALVFLVGFSSFSTSPFSPNSPVSVPTVVGATPSIDELNQQMDAIEKQVEDIRGWSAVKPVPRNFLSGDQLRQHQLDSFEKDYSPAEAHDDLQALLAFGLFNDPAFDLYNFYVDFYSESIAGFYDPDVAELYIISEGQQFGAAERITFAHEYQHALQDQTHGFDALGWTDEAYEADSQRFAALQAMMEGEATVLESQWANAYFTQSDWDEYMASADTNPDSAYYRAPDWMQKDFLFPYTQGYDFVNALYERGGWAEVDKAYSQLPISTEMILHLDKYDSYEQPATVSAPPLADLLGADWRVVDTNNNGEWFTFLILAQYIDEDQARAAAAGWGGDRYTVVYNDTAQQTVAAWNLVWDTESDTEEAIDAFRAYGDKRFGVAATLGDGSLCWDGAEADSCLYFARQSTLWILAPNLGTIVTVRAGIDF